MKKTKEINEYGQNISVRNANLWYGDFQAIKNISVEIPEKQVTAFIGPSGCGKSTFLKCFNRMNDLVDGCKIQGEFLCGRNGYLRQNRRKRTSQKRRYGIPKTKPVPDECL